VTARGPGPLFRRLGGGRLSGILPRDENLSNKFLSGKLTRPYRSMAPMPGPDTGGIDERFHTILGRTRFVRKAGACDHSKPESEPFSIHFGRDMPVRTDCGEAIVT